MAKKQVIVSPENKNATVTIEQLAKDKSGFILEQHTMTSGFIASKHTHTDFEWVYIIKGELRDEYGAYPQGTLKINKKDSVHKPYTKTGCTLLVFTRGKRIKV